MTGSQYNSHLNDRLVFGIVSGDYMDAVFVWNIDVSERLDTPISETSEISFGLSLKDEEPQYDSNTEYAESIENKYGVNIFYGDEADIEFVDYTVDMVYDERAVYKGLRDLERALGLFRRGSLTIFPTANT
jgi:hypothetical protein